MSQIDARNTRHASAMPWEDRAAGEVQSLRTAITNREEEFKVDHEVAPLMAELLHRIDAFTDPPAPSSITPPKIPAQLGAVDERTSMAALGRLSGKVAELVQGTQDETSRQRLLGMLHVVEDHLAMKREILLRAGNTQRG